MNLKKSSSFLLGVLMLFSAMPARADGDGRLSSSKISEGSSHGRDIDWADHYGDFLKRIRENKHDAEMFICVSEEMKYDVEIVDREIRDFKSSRTAPLSESDMDNLNKLLYKRAYIICVYYMSSMYSVTESIERSSMGDTRVRSLVESVSSLKKHLCNIIESHDRMDVYFSGDLREMIGKVQHRLGFYEHKVKLQKVSRDNAILEGAIKELSRDSAILEGEVKKLSGINASLEKNVASLEALVLRLYGKRG